MKPQTHIAEQFFDAAAHSDEAFLEALAMLFRPKRGAMVVSESRPLYAPASKTAELDAAPFTVADALREYLHANDLDAEKAAHQLKIPTVLMQKLLDEMMPLTDKTVPGVARFLSTTTGAPALKLRQWLITGLRDLQMKGSEHRPTRIAARRKKP